MALQCGDRAFCAVINGGSTPDVIYLDEFAPKRRGVVDVLSLQAESTMKALEGVGCLVVKSHVPDRWCGALRGP